MTTTAHNQSRGLATQKQIAFIWFLARQRTIGRDLIHEMAEVSSLKRLPMAKASELIEALKANRAPDYQRRPARRSKPATPYKARRPARLPKGVARFATEAQIKTCQSLCGQLRKHYGWSLEQEAEFFAGRTYSHGGPMNHVRSSTDCVEKIELAKGVLLRARRARTTRQRSADYAATG